MGRYTSITHNCILPTKEEATDFATRAIEHREQQIINTLASDDLSEGQLKIFALYLKKISSCLFFDKDQIKPTDLELTKKDFKEFKKNLKRG